MARPYIDWWSCKETTPEALQGIAQPILEKMGGEFLPDSEWLASVNPVAHFHYGAEAPLTFEFKSSSERKRAMDAVEDAINDLKINGTSGHFIAPADYTS